MTNQIVTDNSRYTVALFFKNLPIGFSKVDFSVWSWLHENPKQYTVFQVNGQSMEPVIQHQDIVFIKSDQSWENADGKIACKD